ncbi:MotA/TolQ/ExbB proton channel family protein [Pseudoalteromonas sp. SR44-5]|uniref:MotA/TolQ/ExbB proton channel family protein n=1 Tax=Pseudoalteromonas sp. SR44-5 TaxID=2760934 RepID=UPI0016017378|nr:MotA/TolQ/ExbB proton channel family protein [Pseudoalteromonas sp. SR44-5]MBB1369043.1 MotA/TolQ/ExbB proton channel family protein [Pseudoalteromonas sp. SR44-5]
MKLKFFLIIFVLFIFPFTCSSQESASVDNSQVISAINNETSVSEAAPLEFDSALADITKDVGENKIADAEVMSAPSWYKTTIELLNTGGAVVYILLLMSVIALTIVLIKLIQFQKAHIWQRQFAKRVLVLWQQGKCEDALNLANRHPNPITLAMARAFRGIKHNVAEPAVREDVLRFGSDTLFRLRRGFRPLEVIASLSPLLGLLGTVLGMISAFQQLEDAGNKVNPAILSGGIWEALLTTAVGLCVAIPVVALLNYLERQVDHLAHEMDNLLTQVFITDLSQQGCEALYQGNAQQKSVVFSQVNTMQAEHAKSV